MNSYISEQKNKTSPTNCRQHSCIPDDFVLPGSFLLSFLLPLWRAVRSDLPHLEERDSFEAMTARTAPSSDSLLAEVSGIFLSFKANARRPAHSPQDHLIITLSSDRRDWGDTRGKWPLARKPCRSWWHHDTSLTLVWPQPPMTPWTTGINLPKWGTPESTCWQCLIKHYYYYHCRYRCIDHRDKRLVPIDFSNAKFPRKKTSWRGIQVMRPDSEIAGSL